LNTAFLNFEVTFSVPYLVLVSNFWEFKNWAGPRTN
jgi:hypothetical protein